MTETVPSLWRLCVSSIGIHAIELSSLPWTSLNCNQILQRALFQSLPRSGWAKRYTHNAVQRMTVVGGNQVTSKHADAIMCAIIQSCSFLSEVIIEDSLLTPTFEDLKNMFKSIGKQLKKIILKRCHERTFERNSNCCDKSPNWATVICDQNKNENRKILNGADGVIKLISTYCSNSLKILVLSDSYNPVPITAMTVDNYLANSDITESLTYLDVSTLVFEKGGASFGKFIKRCRLLETLIMVGTVFKRCDGHILPLPQNTTLHALRLLDLDGCCFCALMRTPLLNVKFRYFRREFCYGNYNYIPHQYNIDIHRQHLHEECNDVETKDQHLCVSHDNNINIQKNCFACKSTEQILYIATSLYDKYDTLVFSYLTTLLQHIPSVEYLDISGLYSTSSDMINLIKNKIKFLKDNNNIALNFFRFYPDFHFCDKSLAAFENFQPDVRVLNDSTFSQSLSRLNNFTRPNMRTILSYDFFCMNELMETHKKFYYCLMHPLTCLTDMVTIGIYL